MLSNPMTLTSAGTFQPSAMAELVRRGSAATTGNKVWQQSHLASMNG
jgi:hypothetical protein